MSVIRTPSSPAQLLVVWSSVLSRREPASLTLCPLFTLTLQSVTERDLVYRGARRKEGFGWSRLCFQCRVSLSIGFWESSNDVLTNWLFKQKATLKQNCVFKTPRHEPSFLAGDRAPSPACYSQVSASYGVHVNVGRPEPVT